MITVALSTTIGAPSERVWRALVDPQERLVWDDRLLGAVELPVPARSPRNRRDAEGTREGRRAGSPRRWRFRLAGVPLVMQDETLGSEPGERLESRISIGSIHFNQTLTLHREDDETGFRTRLGMKLVARNSIAVLGEVVPRLDVQKLVIEYVDTTLRQVQKHCEAGV